LHPDDYWKPQAVKGFVPEEISVAKELLWRISGEKILGKMVKRQGKSKSISEVNDICLAFKCLSEKDCVPMFIGTSVMVAQTPIFHSNSIKSDYTHVNEKLKQIEESLSTMKEECVHAIRTMPIACAQCT